MRRQRDSTRKTETFQEASRYSWFGNATFRYMRTEGDYALYDPLPQRQIRRKHFLGLPAADYENLGRPGYLTGKDFLEYVKAQRRAKRR